MIGSGRRLKTCSLVVFCTLAWPAISFAQDEAFKRGLEARGDRNWAEAAKAMREAIQADGRESIEKKVRVGAGRLNPFGGGTEYLPHYFLGEALKNGGDCVGAVTAWEVSEEQKEVLKNAEYAGRMTSGYKECAAKGVLLRNDFRQQMAQADQAYNEAREYLERLGSVKTNSPDVWRSDMDGDLARAREELIAARERVIAARASRLRNDFNEARNASTRVTQSLRPLEGRLSSALVTRNLIGQQATEIQQVLAGAEANDNAITAAKVTLAPPLAAERETGRTLIARARERLAVAEKTQNSAVAGEALRLANDAAGSLRKLLESVNKLARGEFEQQLQQALAQATAEFSFVTSSFATLERLVAEKPERLQPAMVTERESLQKTQGTLQRRLENARRTENVTGLQDVTRLASEARRRIDALITAFGPASLRDRGVHEALEKGADFYLKGDYRQALTALDSLAAVSDVALRVHVHLFRAASFYALYVASGESNQALRNDAISAVKRCKEIEPAFQPSPRAFSPRFISFFQNPAASEPRATAASAQ